MVYSPVPPATAATPVTPNTTTPAPWVPYTRAGCNVGEVGTANSDLENTAFDLVIALDAGEFFRFGKLYEENRAFFDSATVLNFDHHATSDGCGQVNIIDPVSSATAELLVLFQQQAHLPLNYDAAVCLLAGIFVGFDRVVEERQRVGHPRIVRLGRQHFGRPPCQSSAVALARHGDGHRPGPRRQAP